MKKILVHSLLLLSLFLYSGCASKDINVINYMKNGKLVKSEYQHTKRLYFPDQDCPTCKDEDNTEYECSINVVLHQIAEDSLKKDYAFFTVTPKWPDEPVNFNYKPINNPKRANRYCSEVYYDEDSDLEDDKCHPMRLGSGYPKKFNVMVNYYKKRNPIFPVWSAKETLKETTPVMKKCLSEHEEPVVVGYEQEELE